MVHKSASFNTYSKDKAKKLLDKLSKFYDVNLDEYKKYYFFINSRGKIQMTPINVDAQNLKRISGIGIYFGTMHDNDRFRPSFEGAQIIKPKKNIIEIDENGLKSYISGENLFKDEVVSINWEDKCPFQIVKYEDNFLGAVSIKDDVILNYLSKGRKLDFNKVF